jgi:hypothetical protein
LYVLDVHEASATASRRDTDGEAIGLLDWLRVRRLAVEPEQAVFSAQCDRWDNLYYPQMFTSGGADHWADHFSARADSGMAHVSVNSYAPYVDIPAALTAYTPIENCIPTQQTDQGRQLATLVERVYAAWKDQSDYEMLCHRACVTKSLYGRTASKITWDSVKRIPVFEVVDQPRNLYLGWANSEYNRLDWACYSYLVTPEVAYEDWGVCIETGFDADGKPYPYVTYPGPARLGVVDGITGIGPYSPYPISNYNPSTDIRIEVNDYWYRKPRGEGNHEPGKPVKFDTYNAIFVGNEMVKNEKHSEYRGKLPFVPLFNTYLPGLPNGKSNFWDIEQLLREKDERISENAQMIHRAIAGQMWQLTGAEAPLEVPAGSKPLPNEIYTPGGGNRLEALEPWMPEFQIESYLARIDRELVDVSGLNDLMRGMAPTQVMNSGKAVAALVSNYETRMSMPRNIYYQWRKDNWSLAMAMWVEKEPDLRDILEGTSKLIIESPSLTPRDDAEMSQIALNLKEGKLWSSKRAMDRTGVDDPEAEEDIIREEQTDATINPASVQVMVSLMAMMQQMQQAMPPELQQQQAEAQGSMAANMAAMRGQGTATGTESMNGPGEAPATPPEMMPGNTPEGAAAGAAGPEGTLPPEGAPGAMPSQMLSQYQIQGGEAQPRIVGQQTIQKTE